MVNDALEPVLSIEEDKLLVTGRDGTVTTFDATSRILTQSEDAPAMIADKLSYLPEKLTPVSFPAASIAPSSVEWADLGKPEDTDVQVTLAAKLGEPVAVSKVNDSAAFGNAIHGFLGADVGSDKEARLAQAAKLLADWGEEGSIAPEYMLEASDRLNAHICAHYPDAKVYTEWPLTMRLPNQQQMQGWLDMLLELPEGYVVIDHKSYSGGNAGEHCKQYAPQLAVYKQAVELATGKPVLKTLIHMPMLGEIYEVSRLARKDKNE
jgi:ATP-dependent exoDNAse (exonuclease V) beta subunit